MKQKLDLLEIVCLGLLIVWIISCAVNPVTGKRDFMLLTEADEIALGEQTDKEIIQTYGLVQDSELEAYVTRLGKEMVPQTHRPNLNYQFKVLDTPVINAFAVPGGYVYFTRGILAYLNNEAEFAGVLGHELGHVNARHSAIQYSRAQLAQVGLGIGAIFSEDFRKYAGLAQFGVGLLFMRFSRDNERQADDLGVEYSTKAGYDANYMAEFFNTLERMNPGSDQSGLPGWFSTHPNPVDRIAAVKRKTAELQKVYPKDKFAVNRNEYLNNVNGIVFGQDPRQGYVEGNSFYHPQLKITFSVPSNWSLNNTPEQVQMLSKDQDAAVLFSLAEGATPLDASKTFTQNANAQIKTSDALSINGMQAQAVVSLVPSDGDTLEVLSYFIKKDNNIFAFHGFCKESQFKTYKSVLNQPMAGFKNLTDPKKLNVKPANLKLGTVKNNTTVQQALLGFGVEKEKLEEIALMNGMYLTDQVSSNTLLKYVSK